MSTRVRRLVGSKCACIAAEAWSRQGSRWDGATLLWVVQVVFLFFDLIFPLYPPPLKHTPSR